LQLFLGGSAEIERAKKNPVHDLSALGNFPGEQAVGLGTKLGANSRFKIPNALFYLDFNQRHALPLRSDFVNEVNVKLLYSGFSHMQAWSLPILPSDITRSMPRTCNRMISRSKIDHFSQIFEVAIKEGRQA